MSVSRKAIGVLTAVAATTVALVPATAAAASESSTRSVSLAAECDMITKPPYKSGSRVYGYFESYCASGSPSFTATLYRDGTQYASSTYRGTRATNLSMTCSSGKHYYVISLWDNTNGFGVSNGAWITC
ncbi:hypothetical protein ACNTMW_29345 [Planosporangium sp. 12N6]|uniref:hypothetical protein n=1 Tax=Planosporangium spinosum TaxID=3402278 RepID=UPI003CF7CB1D